MKKMCTLGKRIFNEYLTIISYLRQEKKRQQKAAAQRALALTERLAVGALILCGIGFVGAHQNPVQRTVVFAVAVISTGLDGAFDALVGMTIHKYASF